MSSICLIPARGNSQRLPGKNVKPLAGKPVIQYSIETARASGLFDEIIVSTDDVSIGMLANILGADVWQREPDDGTKGTQEVAGDVLRKIRQAHIACVLYPVAPLVTVHDLHMAYVSMAVGIKPFCFAVGTNPLRDAGAFYVGRADAFRHRIPLEKNAEFVFLPDERVCDVNTPEDWDELERKFAALRGQA